MFKELKIRAEIVRGVAYLYIENHMQELLALEGARKIHAKMQRGTVQQSIKAHVDSRLEQHYPPVEFPMPHGAVMPEFHEMVRMCNTATSHSRGSGSAFENKQSTICLLYTSPSPRDVEESRMPSWA